MMCNLCDENNGIPPSCPDCGRLICFDFSASDDVVAQAYVTRSGDVLCWRCGIAADQADEDNMFSPGYDPYP